MRVSLMLYAQTSINNSIRLHVRIPSKNKKKKKNVTNDDYGDCGAIAIFKICDLRRLVKLTNFSKLGWSWTKRLHTMFGIKKREKKR